MLVRARTRFDKFLVTVAGRQAFSPEAEIPALPGSPRYSSEGEKANMKRFLISFSIFALLTGICAAAAAPANFAGTWVLDKAKSEPLPRMMQNIESLTWVVTQDDKHLTLETKAVAGGEERPAQKSTYNLDGSATTVETGGRMPGKATLTAKWLDDGKILELQSVRNVNMQGNDVTITTKEHWELAEGGKVLKVHRTSETPRGSQESKMVFTRQ
jgi:hypothetical protein